MRITRSDAIAVTALFVALGGTGVAAVGELRDRSVTTAKLADGAVTTRKIFDGAISRRTIHDRAVGPEHLTSEAVLHDAIGPGAVWHANLSPRVQGMIAARAAIDSSRVAWFFQDVNLASNGQTPASIACRDTKSVALSGGHSLPTNTQISASYPGRNRNTWEFVLSTNGPAASGARVYVVCLV